MLSGQLKNICFRYFVLTENHWEIARKDFLRGCSLVLDQWRINHMLRALHFWGLYALLFKINYTLQCYKFGLIYTKIILVRFYRLKNKLVSFASDKLIIFILVDRAGGEGARAPRWKYASDAAKRLSGPVVDEQLSTCNQLTLKWKIFLYWSILLGEKSLL